MQSVKLLLIVTGCPWQLCNL